MSTADRVTIVQYAGDVREAAERLAAGGPETYRGQRYTVDYVQSLAARCAAVTTIIGQTETAFDVPLPGGGRAIGAGFGDGFDGEAIVGLVAETRPTRLILRTPSRPLLRWAKRHRIPTLLLLADSFNDASLKSRIGKLLLGWHLRARVFQLIGNHGLRATRQLAAAGVPRRKLVAWDYPAFDTPADRAPKRAAAAAPRILFVGMLIPEKGVDDLIAAVAVLHRRGIAATLDIIGKGDQRRLAALIQAQGLDDAVTVTGGVANAEIIPRMAAADIVVVPSRHDYSEGMPLTIYEAYCSRTPLIVSDHPMFLGNIRDGESGLVFPAGDTTALADAIARLAGDPALYATLSANGPAAWQRLQIPVKWHELIDRWLEGGPALDAWLATHSLVAERP